MAIVDNIQEMQDHPYIMWSVFAQKPLIKYHLEALYMKTQLDELSIL